MISLFKVFIPKDVDLPLLDVLHSGYVGQGKKVDEFEEEFAQTIGNKNVISVNSGTSALTLAMRLADIQPKDEVIATPMTCWASITPIMSFFAKPVWADVNPMGLIDPKDVERKITERTKAILAVDWGGMPCDYDELMRIGKKYNIKVIDDAAHAIGATYKGRKVGNLADFTSFSLQAIKHITTIDGGMLTTLSSEHTHRAKLLRWYGLDRDAVSEDLRCSADAPEAGYKFHMNDINATIGLAQLPHLDRILWLHRENAAYYRRNLNKKFFAIPKAPYECNSSYWLFTMLLPNNQLVVEFMRHMNKEGIMVSQVHSRVDTHSAHKESLTNLPGVDEFSSRQISIPVHWALEEQEKEHIVASANIFASSHSS